MNRLYSITALLVLLSITIIFFPHNTPTGKATQILDYADSTQKTVLFDMSEGTYENTVWNGFNLQTITNSEGTWTSPVINTRSEKIGDAYSIWDEIEIVKSGTVEYQTRTSQDGENFSVWSIKKIADNTNQLWSPQDKYVQIKLFLADQDADVFYTGIFFTPAFPFEINPFNSQTTEYEYADFQAATRPVVARGSNFYFDNGDGTYDQVKFYGIQMYNAANFPPKEYAEDICIALRKQGFNSIKMQIASTSGSFKEGKESLIQHWQDGVIYYPGTDIPNGEGYNNGSSLIFNGTSWDKLDYFQAKCKEQGIYTYLRLLPPPAFTEDYWLGSQENSNYGYALFFIPEIEQHHRTFYTQLLTHVNPYTGLRWADDPAVAFYEITNENGLVLGWKDNALMGGGTMPGTYDPRPNLTDSQAAYLDELWQDWLIEKYGTTENLANAWGYYNSSRDPYCNNYVNQGYPWPPADETGLRSTESLETRTVSRSEWYCRYWWLGNNSQRYADEEQFYIELETEYYARQMDYLKNNLNANGLVVGSNFFHQVWGQMQSYFTTDFVDFHGYWNGVDFGLFNPLLGQTDKLDYSLVFKGLQSQPANKPYTMSEYNSQAHIPTLSEVLPYVAAYGAFHSWDALYYFSYSESFENPEEWRPYFVAGYFDPVRTTQFPILSRAYRDWISEANVVMLHNVTQTKATRLSINNCGGLGLHDNCLTPTRNVWNTHLFEHSFARDNLSASQDMDTLEFQTNYGLDNNPSMQVLSDTGELYIDGDNAYMHILHDKLQAAIGKTPGIVHTLPDTTISVTDNAFSSASVLIGSVDDQEIITSEEILVVAGSRSEVWALNWTDDHTEPYLSLDIQYRLRFGERPVIAEGVKASISIDTIHPNLGVFILNPNGTATSQIPSTYSNGKLSFEILPEYETLWYKIKPVTLYGDLDNDLDVDVDDLLIAFDHYRTGPGDTNYLDIANLNGDTEINILDFTLLVLNFS